MKTGDVIRFVKVSFVDKDPCWYSDTSDEVEEKDLVIVPYGYQELLGEATIVLKCIYPYVPYKKPKNMISIYKRNHKNN